MTEVSNTPMVGGNNMQVMYSEGDASRENSGCFNITMFACYFETLINREPDCVVTF